MNELPTWTLFLHYGSNIRWSFAHAASSWQKPSQIFGWDTTACASSISWMANSPTMMTSLRQFLKTNQSFKVFNKQTRLFANLFAICISPASRIWRSIRCLTPNRACRTPWLVCGVWGFFWLPSRWSRDYLIREIERLGDLNRGDVIRLDELWCTRAPCSVAEKRR